MRVLFLAKMIQDRILTPYGLYSLSAVCREAGHETDAVDAVSVNRVRRAIKAFRPDVLAISTHTARWPFFKKAAKRLKDDFGLTQLFGGIHPTFRPEIVREPFIDGVCVGEADETLPALLDRMEAGEDYRDVANWCFYNDNAVIKNPLRPLVKDLDSLPFPDFELTDKYRYSRESPLRVFLTSRGCMFKCSYCGNSGFKKMYSGDSGSYYRRASVGRVVSEITCVMNKYPCEFITFFDDHLTKDDDWTFEFAEAYEKIGGPPFSCHMVVQFVERERIKALVRAGLKWVGMSLESGDPEFRRDVLNRHYTNEKFNEAIAVLNDEGVRTYIGNMIAIPGSTLEKDIETLHVNLEAGVGFADASIFTPYPGSTLGEKVLKENLFEEKRFDRQFHSLDASFHTPLFCDVPYRRYVRRLHCLFEIAGDSKWVADRLHFLVRLPLTPLYLVMNKLHNLLRKRFYLYREIHLPIRTQLALVYYNIISS